MKSRFKLNEKVLVSPEDTKPFKGVVKFILKWEDPIFKTKGFTYAVKADDDLEHYRCKEHWLTKTL